VSYGVIIAGHTDREIPFREEKMSLFWKSAYTGLIHRIKEMCGKWALVECQRVSIPGSYVAKEDGELCGKCFPQEKQEEK
jgi:hypothetical protein